MTRFFKPSVVHVITSLDMGGAEAMLAKLLEHWARGGDGCHQVVSLKGAGTYGRIISGWGIPVTCLNIETPASLMNGFHQLVRLLRTQRPHIVQTWLYHADLIGLAAAKLVGIPAVLWNLRCSDMDLSRYAWTTRLVFRMLSVLSTLPTGVIFNSMAGGRFHQACGYSPQNWRYIPNGFDTKRFRPDSDAGRRLRQRLRIPGESILIGMVARRDPMKDHALFFRAALRIMDRHPNVHFLLIGKGLDAENPDWLRIEPHIRRSGRFHLLGRQTDLHAIFPAMDMHTLTSAFGEGFPNVIGEAMSCGVPCVATDVGDAGWVIGETGIVVPPRQVIPLADAWERLIMMEGSERRKMGLQARRRIESHFSLNTIALEYERLYRSLCAALSVF